jgi:hypothetical protein
VFGIECRNGELFVERNCVTKKIVYNMFKEVCVEHCFRLDTLRKSNPRAIVDGDGGVIPTIRYKFSSELMTKILSGTENPSICMPSVLVKFCLACCYHVHRIIVNLRYFLEKCVEKNCKK